MDHKDLLTDDLQVSPQARLFLSESARWGKFLSIVGFIFVGLMAVLSLFLPSFMAKLPPYNQMSTSALSALQATLSVIYFCMAALFFFPCLYLNRFSSRILRGIQQVNQEQFELGFSSLKSMFKFFGIMTIITLSFYILLFLAVMVGLGMKG